MITVHGMWTVYNWACGHHVCVEEGWEQQPPRACPLHGASCHEVVLVRNYTGEVVRRYERTTRQNSL